MKKENNKAVKCLILEAFPTKEILRENLFIDLEKQEIIKVCNNRKLKFYVVSGYKVIQFNKNGKSNYLAVHRLFFYWHYGYLPELIDHKDTDPFNNSIDNLRPLTKSKNNRNRHKQKLFKGKPCSSKYKGVYKYKDSWIASCQVEKKSKHIGVYSTEDEAGQAYNDKMRELGLEEVSVMNDTPQERARENIQFDPLPPEMNHLKDLFSNLEPLVDFK
jgi:hypothetical protein